jgi:hypothetical protein
VQGRGDRGARIIGEAEFATAFAVECDPATLSELVDRDDVEVVEPNYIARAVAVQSSPPSWGLDRIDQVTSVCSVACLPRGAVLDCFVLSQLRCAERCLAPCWLMCFTCVCLVV